MDNILFRSYIIEERSYVSFIKREIHNTVRPAFTEMRTGEVDIVVSELTSNIIKYARGGEVLYRLSYDDDGPLFELLCIDAGPGMPNFNHSRKDGVSSTSSLGQGIGSVIRLSNLAQFYSMVGWGTIVYTRFREDPDHKEAASDIIIRHLNVAMPGESVSGDGLTYRKTGPKTSILVADGLGHGPQAKEAADAAIEAFEESEEHDPVGLIRRMNEYVRKTRGLVGTVATIDTERQQVALCGIGNVATYLYKGLERRNYICNNGIIGMNIPGRLDNQQLPMEKYAQLIFCSDGIKTKWDLNSYPSVLKYDPMLLAASIYKDHARRSDDMTILIAKRI